MSSERKDTESQSITSLSSFEKLPRGSQDYPLEELDNEGPGFRRSLDSEHDNDEPLLPTSASHHDAGHGMRSHRKCSRSGIISWMKGPSPPHKYHINPWFARWQTAPGRLVDRYFPSKSGKVWLLLAIVVAWGVIFLSVLHSYVHGADIAGYGNPVKLACHSRLWPKSTSCGLNGDACRPFDKESFAFSCPAGCSFSMVLEPYTVGGQEVNYQSLVIGGSTDDQGGDPGIYRGDSFICPAAMHAGLISDQGGGCGVLRRTGEHKDFPSVEKNGISSIGYDSYFPLSFTFDLGSSEEADAKCQDLRWPLFAFSLTVTALLALFFTSPALFYTSVFFIVYFQVALSSDPPESPDYYEVVSTALGRFLPTAFVGYAMYYFCIRHTLADLDAHLDKMVLWLGGCWVGALDTDTFDKIPISRLTPHDLQQQPGAITALIILVGVLLLIAITQALAFRNEGRMPKMLVIYGVMVFGVLALVAVPHMNLRIHHYILGLIFLPGTTLRTRPSLLYQGILVGLVINGIARWGYDSILETPAALLGDAQLGSLLPEIAPPLILSNESISFTFQNITEDAAGVSALVNDIERFHSFRSEDGSIDSFNWTRYEKDVPEYFRFGYMKMSSLGGVFFEDFTRPAVWNVDGSWNQSSWDDVD